MREGGTQEKAERENEGYEGKENDQPEPGHQELAAPLLVFENFLDQIQAFFP